MDPVPSVPLLIACFGKLRHAGLNNEERMKRLRGARKDRETLTTGNPANIAHISVYLSNQGIQTTEVRGREKILTMKRSKGQGQQEGLSLWEEILPEGCTGWAAPASWGLLLGKGIP